MTQQTGRLFLVERGTFVVVRKADGTEVGFATFAEFNAYYPTLDLTGKDYICYDVPNNIYIDNSDDNISIANAPNADYEAVIDAFDTIKANVDDAFFDMTVAEAKTLRKQQVQAEANNIIYTKWPQYKQDNCALGGVTGYDAAVKTQVVADINTIVSECNTAEAAIDALTTVANIKAYTASFTSI